METRARADRNELFQQLKPRCIELSQLALRSDGSPNSTKALIQSTTKLLEVLQQKCQRSDGSFDEKLADYVFFPLSQILQKKKTYSDSLSEITVKCLAILLEHGWRRSIALDLAKQLLILLTFVAGGVPGQAVAPVPEELIVEAYKGLAALFRDLSITPGGAACLVETSTVPALSHCVTVILDGIRDGKSPVVQIQALVTLRAVWRCVKDTQALSSFLPGTISALTRCLLPTTTNRRSGKTIVTALEALEHVLISLLSDFRTRNIKETPGTSRPNSKEKESRTLTKSWLQATTGQIKLALSNVIRLRSHESVEVRKALNKLAITVLDECHDTLAESASMLVETCMTLNGIDPENILSKTTTLADLATIHTDIGELIKSTVYNWATSLPRIMQSNDESSKHVILNQLSKAHKLLTDLNLFSSTLEDALANSLWDSVTVTLDSSAPIKSIQETVFDLNSQAAMTLVSSDETITQFKPIILSEESRKETRIQLINLLKGFGTRESQIKMASDMLEHVRGATGQSLLSAYWISSQLLKSATMNNKELDMFFTSSLTLSDSQEVANQELFSYSLSVLNDADNEDMDWRLRAIALEEMASRAQFMKARFRTELVDTLYPIAQLLGSPHPQLREHAITALNIISRACNYTTVSDLIISNVDYMVNAISLRLNTFDISPQAPQVLVMMIRLSGPSLLPYLDDVVGSIFGALDNFHGYGKLVDVLFSVLGEIVDVGSKSPTRQIEGTALASHRKSLKVSPTMKSIISTLSKPKSGTNLAHENFPRKPWKSANTLLDEVEAFATPSEGEEPPSHPQEIEKPPPTKIYIMLQNIARQSQHYLTSSSPNLRSKLLALITNSCTALQHDEDAFLPLINDVWPVILPRLYDPEHFVSIAACRTISALCVSAGDFLTTRIITEWNSLLRFARSAKATLTNDRSGRGIYSQASQVWEAVVGLLVTVVVHVRVEDEMFEQVLEVLGEELGKGRMEVMEVLEGVNADAVWWVMQAMDKNPEMDVPVVDGYTFAPWAILS